MSKPLGRHPEKNHQNLSLHISYQNKNPDQIRVISLKVDIYDLRFTKEIDIEDLNPYFVVTTGKDIQKTSTPKDRNENYFVFYEVLEFKNVREEKLSIAIYHKKQRSHSDKILGGNSIDLKNFSNLNSMKLDILNYQHEVIATSDLRITQIDYSYQYAEEEKKHRKNLTDNAIGHFQTIPSLPASIDLTNDLVNKMNQGERKMVAEDQKFDKKILRPQKSKENIIYQTPAPKERVSSVKKSTKKSIESIDLETNIITLEDIERIKFDLNQEKNKIRIQETKLNKLIRKFKIMEVDMEDEKKRVQTRKDHLTQQELMVLEERKKYEHMVQLFEEDKENHQKNKEAVIQDLEQVRHSTILQKAKNLVLANKLAEMIKRNEEFENRNMYLRHKISDKIQLKTHFNSERFEENNFNTLFSAEQTETVPVKPHHKKENSSVLIGGYGLATLKESEHKKTLNKENLILKIKLEKNRSDTIEKEIQDLNKLEEYLMTQVRKNESTSRTKLKRLFPSNSSLPIQTPNNTLRFVKNVSASLSLNTSEIENKDLSAHRNLSSVHAKVKSNNFLQRNLYTPKPLSINNSLYSFDMNDYQRKVVTEEDEYF